MAKWSKWKRGGWSKSLFSQLLQHYQVKQGCQKSKYPTGYLAKIKMYYHEACHCKVVVSNHWSNNAACMLETNTLAY